MKKRLLTISDGNGVDNDFIKWPSLLRILAYDHLMVDNRSVVGASNEMMLMILAEALQTSAVDCVIIQWSVPIRLDVELTDFWREQSKSDETYSFNVIQSNKRKWWVTSASKNTHIRLYHDRYISTWQAIQRSQSYMLAASRLLREIPYTFTLAYEFQFEEPLKQELDQLHWALHENNLGLSDYRNISKNKKLDKGLSQPHSAIQLEWIHNVLKPKCDYIKYPDKRYFDIERRLIEN